MAPNSAGPSGKRPHPASRARRVTAVVSGVAFVGLASGMAVDASTSAAHAATVVPPEPSATTAPSATTEPTWAAPLSAPQTVAPQTQLPQVQHRADTQTSGS